MDWGAGHYETIARQLLASAAAVVDDAEELDLAIEFVTGDAAVIPIADASVDIVLSVFGLIFAPDARAAGEGDRPPPFAWHDSAAVGELFGGHGFRVHHREHDLAFIAESPGAFAATEFADHPVWIAARQALEAAQARETAQRRVTEILRDANEDPGAFRVTSRYLVFIAARP